jgi:hypothetical protein
MSERSIYLRDQADKCRRHATAMTDPLTQAELRKLAIEYTERAAEIETKEKGASPFLLAYSECSGDPTDTVDTGDIWPNGSRQITR